MKGFLIILAISVVIALVSALLLKRKGYSFAHSFIKAFLAAAGILSVLYSVFRD